MTDTKLDPKSLSAEERAIVDHEASRFHRDWTGEARYQAALGICEPIILARRAIFGGAEGEGAKVECPDGCGEMIYEDMEHYCRSVQPESKVECPNCRKMTSESHRLGHPHYGWDCESAQPESNVADFPGNWADVKADSLTEPLPEPAAPVEMPWSVRRAISKLREMKLPDCDGAADDLANCFSFNAAQPAPVRMTREYKMVEDAAAARGLWHLDNGQRQQFNEIADSIAAVRAQAEEARTVKLPEVRALLEDMSLTLTDKPHKPISAWGAAIPLAITELDTNGGA